MAIESEMTTMTSDDDEDDNKSNNNEIVNVIEWYLSFSVFYFLFFVFFSSGSEYLYSSLFSIHIAWSE